MNGPSSALPISSDEFHAALSSACRAVRKCLPVGSRKLRLGLAVSGGVDSMALAALCSKYDWETGSYPVRHAFTVDHAARAGSDEEAKKVGQELRRLGLHHQILTVNWPDGVDPSNLRDFESKARRHRYRALGSAARYQNLDALLLAHHEDDQAETMLMRLVSGRAGPGLRGMSAAAQIPECWGMYAVHQSGKPRFTNADVERKIHPGANVHLVGLEDGGIAICRPLLGFSKERLTATCRAHQVPWFEDKTNTDHTLTKRNAIRHLLEQQRLPVALRKESVLNVVRAKRAKYDCQSGRANQDFKRHVISMDLRSGVLHVRFGMCTLRPDRIPAQYLDGAKSKVKTRAAFFLREAVSMVTPNETVDLRQMACAVDAVFPTIDQMFSGIPSDTEQPVRFTTAGVCFTPVGISASPTSDDNLDTKWTWKISRQPYPLNTPVPKLAFPPGDSPTWHLFDGRFWFQIANRTSNPITLRPLLSQDINKLRKAMMPHRVKYMNDVLISAVEGKVRGTLPVIATRDGEVLAMPTLGVIKDQVARLLTWKVSFKKIDLGAEDESVIVRGNTAINEKHIL